MATFTTAPIEQVTPKRKAKGPSQRERTRHQYQEALQHALQSGEALVVELEAEDKPLTIRNRLQRAGRQLGIGDLVIRRRGQQIVAYQPFEAEGTQAGEGSPAILEEGIAS